MCNGEMPELQRCREKVNKASKETGEMTSQTPDVCGIHNTKEVMPESKRQFVPNKVEYLIKTVLDAYLHKVDYDPVRCSKLAEIICSVIKEKTKEFHFDRYKLIVQVYVGQDNEQSVQLASRSLWNTKTDMFAAATYRNNSLYAIALVYGLYLE
ncbi:hypothetical protein LSH36_1384g00032 [Paralvinella palmiformis]|uniref:Uncharacterized protein n=1 Tax=Paralvinella palmiformis TaxID=53620 RepID=A0AAD9ISW3_9ANNE|nr:hypothetical protein LSH36_1384g00032 [Paralvinella palmiformis]